LLLIGSVPFAKVEPPPAQEFRLRLYHTHTGERLDVVYRLGNRYIPEALAQADHFLRDHKTGECTATTPACSIR
jgi:uncharacterized protein YcbK (DUF882 family)